MKNVDLVYDGFFKRVLPINPQYAFIYDSYYEIIERDVDIDLAERFYNQIKEQSDLSLQTVQFLWTVYKIVHGNES